MGFELKEVMDRPIAVLGGGAAAQTMAADLSLAGCEVHLYELPDFREGMGKVIDSGTIEITGPEMNLDGFKRNGTAEIDVVTTDMDEALEGVGLINVAVPAIGHESFFEKMMPCLEDGHVVSIFPDNFGSLVLKRMLWEEGIDLELIIGGWSTMPYATRVLEPGKVNLLTRTIEIRGEALPSSDREDFWKVMKSFPPFDPAKLVKGDTVVDIGLSNPNPVVHCPGSLLSIGAMENYGRPDRIYGDEGSDYSLYSHGLSPSIAKVMISFYEEEREIAKAMGIDIVRYDPEEFMSRSNVMMEHYLGKGREYVIPFEDEADELKGTGPTTVENRYFTEDIPIGTRAYYGFAKKFGVEVPVIESIIRLGSVVCGRDFMKEGRSLEDMGLADMSKDEILNYLREGE